MAVKAILLDRDREVYPLLADIFNITNHKVLIAPDDKTFKDLIASSDVDMVIINHADIPSWKLTLKEKKLLIPFFIVDTEEDEERLLKLGFSELNYVRKPFNPLELLNKLAYLNKLDPKDSLNKMGLINALIKLSKEGNTCTLDIEGNLGTCSLLLEKGQISSTDCSLENLRTLIQTKEYKLKKREAEEIKAEAVFKDTADFLLTLLEKIKPIEVITEKKLLVPEAVEEIEENLFRVSKFTSTGVLLKNVYLRIFEGKGKRISFLINAGTIDEWSGIKNLVEDVLLSLKELDAIVILSGNLTEVYNTFLISEEFSKLHFITDSFIKRSLSDSGCKAGRIRTLADFVSYRVRLATGHNLRFIPLNFSPSLGGFCMYEEETGFLYTPEFLSSFYSEKSEDANRIKTLYHRIYTPSGSVLSRLIERVEHLKVKKVFPRYGLLYEDFIDTVHLLKGMKAGMDFEPLDGSVRAKEILSEVIRIITDLEERDQAMKFIEEMGMYASIESGIVSEVYISPPFLVELIIKNMLSVASIKPSTFIEVLDYIASQDVFIPPF